MPIYTKYASLRVEDLPYPEGLGKEEHKGLQAAVKNLLGADALDSEVHEAHFWTRPYQAVVAEHLAPFFAKDGDIVDIARQGLEIADGNPAFDVAIPEGENHIGTFAANLPPNPATPAASRSGNSTSGLGDPQNCSPRTGTSRSRTVAID